MLPSDILFKAANLIEPEGRWVQGNFAQEGGRYCAAGAIFFAAPLGDDRRQGDAASALFCKVIRRKNIGHWNDVPSRTQAEVIAALRQAALLARETEAVAP